MWVPDETSGSNIQTWQYSIQLSTCHACNFISGIYGSVYQCALGLHDRKVIDCKYLGAEQVIKCKL